MNDCIGCNQAKTQQKINDEKVINIAKKRAAEQNQAVALYRNESGELCIVPNDGNFYPAIMQVTPLLQGN